MWEGYDDHSGGKPYIWIFFLLVLLLMSSIFFLRPNISSLPGNPTQGSKNVPLVNDLVAPGIGTALYLGGSNTGLWAVSMSGSEYAVSYLNSDGLTTWQNISQWEDPLIKSHGEYLVMAEANGSILKAFSSARELVIDRQLAGNIRDISISETGEILVAYTKPDEDQLTVRSYILQVSALGGDTWEVAVQGTEILRLAQSGDGSLIGVLALHLEGDTARTTLAGYSKHGARLFIKDFASRPVDVAVRLDGAMIAVAIGREIHVFDRQGDLAWSYDAGADLGSLFYVGRSVNLVYYGQRKTVLTFGAQSVVGVLSETGRMVWQYRTRDEILSIGLSEMTTNVLICTESRIHLYSHDGNIRWSMTHDWGDTVAVATTDGRSYFVHTGPDAFLLRSQ